MKREYWGLLALLLVTGVAYLPALGAGFVWDDSALVLHNKLTGDLSDLGAYFTTDLWQTLELAGTDSGYYRPLMLLSLAVDRALFGLSPVAHHAHSVLWHLATVAALWGLARRLVGPTAALMAAAVFALHPVQIEAVTLIAARNDAMAASATLFALTLLDDARDAEGRGRWLRVVFAGLSTLFGLLCKELAVLAPLLLLALDLARERRPRGWDRYAALGVALALWFGLRANAGVGSAASPPASSYELAMTHATDIAGVYASSLLLPWPLTPARHLLWLPEPRWPYLVGLGVLLGALVVAVRSGRRREVVLFGLVLAAMSFVPSLYATVAKGLLGERYLYLPLAGLSLALAGAVDGLPYLLRAAGLAAIPALVAMQLRLPDWESSLTLWGAAHRSEPTPYTAGGYGFYVYQAGRIRESQALFIEAVGGDPPYRESCTHVLMSTMRLKDYEEAVRLGDWALRKRGCPPLAETLGHYALALASTGRWEKALAATRQMDRDPFQHALIVIAAARVRSGDRGAVAELKPHWQGSVPFERQVGTVLRLAEEAKR